MPNKRKRRQPKKRGQADVAADAIRSVLSTTSSIATGEDLLGAVLGVFDGMIENKATTLIAGAVRVGIIKRVATDPSDIIPKGGRFSRSFSYSLTGSSAADVAEKVELVRLEKQQKRADWGASDHGQQVLADYAASEHGKQVSADYEASEHGKEVRADYTASDRGQQVRAEARAKYDSSEHGQQVRAEYKEKSMEERREQMLAVQQQLHSTTTDLFNRVLSRLEDIPKTTDKCTDGLMDADTDMLLVPLTTPPEPPLKEDWRNFKHAKGQEDKMHDAFAVVNRLHSIYWG